MAIMAEVRGVKQLVNNLKRSDERFRGLIHNGLKKAGLMLQRDSQKLVPVDTGLLKASATTRSEGEGFDTVVRVSYSTAYAMFVHEDMTKRHGLVFNIHYAAQIAAGVEHSRGVNQQAKFLEDPARQNREKYSIIVREEALKIFKHGFL